jgi:hypothetical protein
LHAKLNFNLGSKIPVGIGILETEEDNGWEMGNHAPAPARDTTSIIRKSKEQSRSRDTEDLIL